MNILILSWRGPGHPNAGGAEISTHEHANAWVKAGHSVTLFTASYKGGKKEEWLDGIHIIRSGRQFFGVQWEALKWYLFAPYPKYDLVIDQFHGIPFFTPFYVRVKILAFIHEVTKEVWRLNPWPWPFNQIVGMLGTFLEPSMFKILYRHIPFMTVSESTKKDLIAWSIPPDNITVVHNGLHLPKAKIYPKEQKKTLIFLGALSKDKGIEDALRIFSKLSSGDDVYQFWVVGYGGSDYLKSLKLQVKKLNIGRKVKFWGFVSERLKYKLLSRAHILINPSIREGWGLVVIEAASVGTPTVGYNVAGLRDSIIDSKTGILCDPNPDACAEAVLSLIRNEEKYQRFRQECFEWSKKFTWEKSTRESLKLIEKLVQI